MSKSKSKPVNFTQPEAAIIHGAALHLLREVNRLDMAYAGADGWDDLGDHDGSARRDRDEAWFLANRLADMLGVEVIDER